MTRRLYDGQWDDDWDQPQPEFSLESTSKGVSNWWFDNYKFDKELGWAKIGESYATYGKVAVSIQNQLDEAKKKMDLDMVEIYKDYQLWLMEKYIQETLLSKPAIVTILDEDKPPEW